MFSWNDDCEDTAQQMSSVEQKVEKLINLVMSTLKKKKKNSDQRTRLWMCLVKSSRLNQELKMKDGAGHEGISKLTLSTRRYSKCKGPETGVCLRVAGVSSVHFLKGPCLLGPSVPRALWKTRFCLVLF